MHINEQARARALEGEHTPFGTSLQEGRLRLRLAAYLFESDTHHVPKVQRAPRDLESKSRQRVKACRQPNSATMRHCIVIAPERKHMKRISTPCRTVRHATSRALGPALEERAVLHDGKGTASPQKRILQQVVSKAKSARGRMRLVECMATTQGEPGQAFALAWRTAIRLVLVKMISLLHAHRHARWP